jgi:hypothetical protein
VRSSGDLPKWRRNLRRNRGIVVIAVLMLLALVLLLFFSG